MNDVKGKNVLITGGSGLIGSRLTELLLEKRYEVSHLSRKKNPTSPIKTYQWDPKAGFIEEGAFDNVDYVIHLAGENLAGHRWTESFKKTIVESRVQSSELLKKTIAISPKVKSIACASGIGIYKDENDQWIDESSFL